DSSLDLLEQHQAREQARLLQRFRELREWQQQQQQQLMNQQQQQLRTWQDEQSKVQTLIANQGVKSKSIKPSVASSGSPLMTPPTKPRQGQVINPAAESVSQSQMAGVSLDSGLVVSMQDTLKSQSSLPKPVMYPSLTSTLGNGDDNDDDKYTNSELFSNLGEELQERAREMDEDSRPVPDWMSDSSENFLRGSQLPPPRMIRGGNQLAGLEQLLKTAPAGFLQQMLGLLPGGKTMESNPRGGRTPEEVELSASPTFPQQKQQPAARRLFSYHNAREEMEGREATAGDASIRETTGAAVMMENAEQRPQQNQSHQQQLAEMILLHQKQEQLIQQQRRNEAQAQPRSHGQGLQSQQTNGLVLGPAFSDQDVDPRFVPRSFGLQDGDFDPQSFRNGLSGHGHNREGVHLQGEDDDEDVDDESYEEDEDQASVSGEEEEERTTQASGVRNHDRPIKGTGGRKSFEQLLEEQLQQEKEKLQQMNGESGSQRKIPFLRKGQGTARFNSAPKKPPPKKSSASRSQSRSHHSSDPSGGARAQSSEGGGKKSSVGSRLKSMGKPADAGQNFQGDKRGTELDSLAEFEVLEEAADNMSMCSSSSLIGRLVYGDRQGQKDAVQKLKTITESLKSARSDRSGSGLEGKESGAGFTSANLYSNNNNNNSNNNNNGIVSQYKEDKLSSAFEEAMERREESQGNESSEVTLTESSEEEEEEETDERLGAGEMFRPDANTASPSKVLTRKVAPLASKYSAANDTLSLLKSLSAQASVLTSNPPHSSSSSETSAVTTSTSSVSSKLHPLANPALSEGFNFFSGSSTLPPNLFSTASKEGMLLSSGFGSIMAQTFQPSSSVFTPAPVSSSGVNGSTHVQNGGSAESKSQLPNRMLNGQEYVSGKYGSESSDEDTQYSSDEADSQGEESGEKESDKKEAGGDKEKKETHPQDGEASKVNGVASAFDDESAWEDEDDFEAFDKASTLKAKPVSEPGPVAATGDPTTPPTSRLVSKLFPKLRPKPSAEAEKVSTAIHQSLQQASSQPVNAATGIQSSILREKLKELDTEIEKFRSENANLDKLRREREEGLAKLKQEIESFQKEKESELRRLEEFKAEEMKKLKRERKLFESYQKKLRSMPDKREREEIENLKMQLEEVQEELKRKESRWTASTARLKNRVAELELENGEVKEEVRILERKRLEWMTSQASGSGRSGGHSSSNGKIGGPASIGGASAVQTVRTSLNTKASVPSVTSGSSNIGSNHNNNNNTTRGRSSKHPSSHTSNNNMNNNNNNNNNHTKTNNSGGKAGLFNGLTQSSTSNKQQSGPMGLPASTATLVAPSVPVMVLSPPIQQHQHHHPHSQQQPPLEATSREGSDGLQAMQNTAVPVMMECTIPAGTDVSKMPGLQANQRSPDKSAARLAIERAVVDKGDPSVFTESVHQDGKTEKIFGTGAKEIRFPNGTVKEISADGQTIVCRLANGDIRQILPDHRVVYIFSEAQIMQTTFPDGLETFQFQNGQIERRYPDGTVEITFPSKDIKYLFPDGGQEVILTDGTVMQYNSKGERTVEYPSGDREVHTAEFQRREFPDGIIKTIYADGRHETRFPNGRVRMRDKDGNVVMDQIVYR
ncbi:hypothetical protein EGW08_013600, partial [Elysia chlorotica]